MSIAQRFVAGEGEAYPRAAQPSLSKPDATLASSYSSDSTNLPWLIFRATHRAAHVQGLLPRARTVLAALARTVDSADPYAAIFARRELLTGRAMQSMRTFYRSLDDLEAAGLIARPAQRRYVQAGLFGRAYLHLTEQAAILLGLAEPSSKGSLDAADQPAHDSSDLPDSTRSTERGDGANSSSSFPLRSVTMADGAIYKDLYPKAFQKRQSGQLPTDLQRLRSLGFHDFLTFKLMREAREQGKRLSDVVEVTWQHLQQANAPINYLRTLLRGTTDFAHQLRTRTAAREEQHDRLRRQQQAEQIVERFAGCQFVSADGQQQVVVGQDGDSMTVYRLDEAIPRAAAGKWKTAFVEAVQSGRLQPATDADCASITQARTRRSHLPAERHLPSSKPMGERILTEDIRDQLSTLRSIVRSRSRLHESTLENGSSAPGATFNGER